MIKSIINYLHAGFFLVLISCQKEADTPEILTGVVLEKFTGRPIGNAKIGFYQFMGSCGTDFCTGGNLLVSSISKEDGSFQISRKRSEAGYLIFTLPVEIQKKYAMKGWGGSMVDKSKFEFFSIPFSYLNLNVSITNNRHTKLYFSPKPLNIIDSDSGAWLLGNHFDTTFTFRCIAESNFGFGYTLTNLTNDSVGFDNFNIPIGSYRDTFFHRIELDISKTRLQKK